MRPSSTPSHGAFVNASLRECSCRLSTAATFPTDDFCSLLAGAFKCSLQRRTRSTLDPNSCALARSKKVGSYPSSKKLGGERSSV